MGKSAEEVLAVFESSMEGFSQVARRRAKRSQHLLQSLLNDDDFRRNLAYEFSRKNHVIPLSGPYPIWAYEIAYRIEDPDYRFSSKGRSSLVDVCRSLVDEADDAEPFVAPRLVEMQESPLFLQQVARDLLIKSEN